MYSHNSGPNNGGSFNSGPSQVPQAGWGAQAPMEAGELRFMLTLPVTRIGVGSFGWDPVEQFLGCSIAHLLEPAMTAPVFQRPSMAGPACNCYPLSLPPGEGISIRLGALGELGFANDNGILRLVVPLSAAPWVQQRFAGSIVRGPEQGPSMDGTATVGYVWIALRSGMRAGVPIPHVGELGIEVA